jgi:hypothetical protein
VERAPLSSSPNPAEPPLVEVVLRVGLVGTRRALRRRLPDHGYRVLAPPSSAAGIGTVKLSGLTIDGRPVDLGGAGSWRDNATDNAVVTGTFVDGALNLRYDNGIDKAFLTHSSVPDIVPALTTPAATPSAPGATFGCVELQDAALAGFVCAGRRA